MMQGETPTIRIEKQEKRSGRGERMTFSMNEVKLARPLAPCKEPETPFFWVDHEASNNLPCS